MTSPELATDVGKQLLELTVRIASDGLIEPMEVDQLQTFVKNNRESKGVAAIAYLDEILSRITADGMVDRDELIELHLAIERVIPAAQRDPIVRARKDRENAQRERLKVAKRVEREKEHQEKRKRLEQEHARQHRIRHAFAKVAGVTFPNDDGSERQRILGKCKEGEQLVLYHDPGNEYSSFAVQVLRVNGEQLGYAPEYLAERICDERESGYKAIGVLKDLTGGSRGKPTRGANFVVLFVAAGVNGNELQQYVNGVFAGEGAEPPGRVDVALAPSRMLGSPKPWWKFW